MAYQKIQALKEELNIPFEVPSPGILKLFSRWWLLQGKAGRFRAWASSTTVSWTNLTLNVQKLRAILAYLLSRSMIYGPSVFYSHTWIFISYDIYYHINLNYIIYYNIL